VDLRSLHFLLLQLVIGLFLQESQVFEHCLLAAAAAAVRMLLVVAAAAELSNQLQLL
jgi:hypothetical protein